MRIRWYSLLAVCAVALSACSTTPALTLTVEPVTTQPAPIAARRQVTFQTDDGVMLSGTLFGQGQVGVALSHMFPTDQTSWHAFAQTLADTGYLAPAYDFRGYGQSGGQKRIDQIDRDDWIYLWHGRFGSAQFVCPGSSEHSVPAGALGRSGLKEIS